MSNKAPDRTATITVAILAAIAIGTIATVLNRERLAEAYHGRFTFGPYRKPLLDILKDPESAKFRREFLAGDFLCGEVNSKNGYGAYPGFSRYISSRDGFARMEGDSLVFADQWARLCKQQTP